MANGVFATAPSKNASVGADAYIGPPYNRCTPCPCVGAGFYPARRLIPPIGADASACPSPRAYTALAIKCHCKARARTGCGERAERCQWQEKRGERVAAVKVSSVRRKAAQKFWAPQQGHRPLRNPIGKHSVGVDAYIGPTRIFPAPTAGHTGPALQSVALPGPGGQGRPPPTK